MFFELREYRTKPGKRANWVEFMEEEIMPFQSSKGMVIIGSYIGQEEDDLYVWMRRFESEEERTHLYEAIYETDTWKNYFDPKVAELLDRDKIIVRRIEATPRSVTR